MFRPSLIGYGLCAVIVLAGGAAGSAGQYARPKPAEGPDSNPLTGHLIKTGLYMFSGSSNSLLRLTANGLIVVDGQPPANYEALVARVKKISDQEVRLLITTDHHQERTGSNAKFIEDGAQILAHENVTKNLVSAYSGSSTIPPPTKTFDREFTVSLGGVEVKLMHFGSAHTSGDSVVYFPNLRVVAVGDLFAKTPDPDFAAGGSLVGWGPVLADILKLDFDTVVPGTGPPVSRAELEAFKTRMDTLVSRAAALVRKGVARDRLMGELKTDDLGWRLNLTGVRLDRFYAELGRAK